MSARQAERISVKAWLLCNRGSLGQCWQGLEEEWRSRGGYAVRLLQPHFTGGIGLRALRMQKRVNIAVIEKAKEEWHVVVTPRGIDARVMAVKLMLRGGNYRD